jgi:uncharacterized membrane protein
VPVIANALNDLPSSFEQLAATQSNVARLKNAGVRVSLGQINNEEGHQLRWSTQYAGNLVALGRVPGHSGLSWGEALRTITSAPAEALGMGNEIGSLRPGRRGDVVVWDGDPLENGSSPVMVMIDGVQQPLENRQTKLRDRYLRPRRRRSAQGLRKVIEHAGLALATAVFVGTHLALSHPLRTRLVQTVGEAGFTGVYSIVAALTLLWVVLAYRAIDVSVPFWIAPEWAWWVASAAMLLASILLVGSFVRNPAFPHPDAAEAGGTAGHRRVRHHPAPMNCAVILWALTHLALWWSPRNIIVALGMLSLAVAGSIGQDRKKRSVIGRAGRMGKAHQLRPVRRPSHRPRRLEQRRAGVGRARRRHRLLAGRHMAPQPSVSPLTFLSGSS